ncbi:multi-sensor hybrid histidine kinase [Calothrix sp. NIES-2100]|uniref:DUF4118 domain-containing protein n=1 Tax=Calothrix sp. NIES-2100 TaxID=1954172 RepID=UPI000B5EBB6C|nr:multi-sensor hybrid histidine kinase [Calothrix sp. NIES-2100]
MWRLRRSQLQSYSIVCLSVLLALLLTLLLWQLHRLNSIYPLFLAAVTVSSWYGGFNPGLVATFLSAIVCAYFLLPPFDSLAVSGFKVVGLVQFVLVGLLISSLNSALRQARSQAQQNYERLRQSEYSLRQSEERYRLLVEGVTNYAIFMLDPNGNFTSWNIGAERILDVGAGVAIETSDDPDVGLLLTGGVDVPLNTNFTATAGVNAAFLDETDVGLMLGVGYNFTGF